MDSCTGQFYGLCGNDTACPMTCDLLFNTMEHMVMIAPDIIFEQPTRECFLINLLLRKKTRKPVKLSFFVFTGIILRRKYIIVELGMGNLMDKRGNGLYFAHPFPDADALFTLPEYTVTGRGHLFITYRNR